MSKFVTYPAVTVLDNDHSLLIDDPNAGTNSITAENAGNTLLSKWAGFETFDEAVQNTIEHNQEFIDRDTAIREETAELKKKIVTTFPSKEASGAVATFESEFEDAPLKSCIVRVEPVQDLHGYDSPWPGGGGTNQWDEQWEVGAIDFDTGELIDSTNTIRTKNYIPVTGGVVYQIVFPNPNSNTMRIIQYDANKEYIRYSTANATNGMSKTLNASTAYLKFYMGTSYGSTYGNDIAINYPSTVTTYAPYENICPITGWESVEIQHGGTNFFDGEMENGDINQYTGENNGTSSSRYRSKNYIPIRAGSYYFKSPNRTGTVRLFAYDKDKTFLYILTWNVNSSNAIDSSKVRYIRFRFSSAKVDGDEQISINSPSGVTDYVPYVGRTYPITFPTETGTIYGAYVDVVNGKLVVDRAIVTIYEDDIIAVNVEGKNCRVIVKSGKISIFDVYRDGVCNKAVVKTSWAGVGNDTGAIGINNPASNQFVANNAFGTTLQEIKNFVGTDGLQICTYLATPIHYPLTPTEIKTLLGQNNVWADCGDTEVEYLMSDVSWYVEKKLRAFQSILAGAEDSSTASKNYSANTYLIFNDDIYRVTKAITAGETIEEGVNVTKTTVAEQLLALAQA